jgi:hypothetical protein
MFKNKQEAEQQGIPLELRGHRLSLRDLNFIHRVLNLLHLSDSSVPRDRLVQQAVKVFLRFHTYSRNKWQKVRSVKLTGLEDLRLST